MRPDNLFEHPEGGRFRQVFRSNAVVTTSSGLKRCALTHIYFALNRGEASRFHRVKSDEIWNFYQGAGIRLYTWVSPSRRIVCNELSGQANEFCHAVEAGTWQAAEPISGPVLLGCSVGPGFEYDDFELIEPGSDAARRIQSLDAEMSRFIEP